MIRSDVLKDCGFDGGTPYFTYYDEDRRPQMELYFDEASGAGCGFRYDWSAADGEKAVPQVYGFSFSGADSSADDPWGDADPYSVTSILGTDGSELVSDYMDVSSRDSSGRLERFSATGIPLDGEDTERTTLIDITFTYRKDGSLACKRYAHDPRLFGTASSPTEFYYDEQERLTYVWSYVTHGRFEYYYIYNGEDNRPAYCLLLDCDGGSDCAGLLDFEHTN
jgi:hypothetical protein